MDGGAVGGGGGGEVMRNWASIDWRGCGREKLARAEGGAVVA